MEYRYTAIVIGKKDVNETDRLYTFYTREAGKVRAIARGVRKPEAKLAGQLETFTLGAVTVARGRGQGNVIGAVAEEYFPRLRESATILPMAFEAAGAVERLSGYDETDEAVFRLFSTLLFLLDRYAEQDETVKAALVLEGFFFSLFSALGYQLELARCAGNGETLNQGENHFFSAEMGGVVCETHRGPRSMPIRENGIKLLRIIRGNRLELLGKLSISSRDLEELRMVRKFFLQSVIG